MLLRRNESRVSSRNIKFDMLKFVRRSVKNFTTFKYFFSGPISASYDDFLVGQKFLKKCVAAIEKRGKEC